MDESYCYLYVPSDVQQYGASGAANINNSPHNYESTKNKGMSFAHLKIKEIRNYMYEIYAEQLFKVIDIEEFVKSEIENKGIVVIDEIDKLVRGQDASASSTKASDEGVQYDLLPLLDGTTVTINNKVKLRTRNILFVAGGAFEKVKPTELAIELQGRLPVNAKM
jgi:ATP-dependent HslUV protease ATP-binding subunit HslU